MSVLREINIMPNPSSRPTEEKPRRLQNARDSKNIVRSFSINERVFNQLSKIAEGEGISLNRVINKVLEREVRCYPHRQHGVLLISCRSMKELLSKMEENEIIEIGKINSESAFREPFIAPESFNFERFRELVKNFFCEDKYWGKFDYSESENKLSIHHDLGQAWSIYLKSFFNAGLEKMVGEKGSYRIVISENVLVIQKQ